MELEEMYERLFVVDYPSDFKYQTLCEIEDELFTWYRAVKRGDQI